VKDRFRAAENAAKREKRGIWSLAEPPSHPAPAREPGRTGPGNPPGGSPPRGEPSRPPAPQPNRPTNSSAPKPGSRPQRPPAAATSNQKRSHSPVHCAFEPRSGRLLVNTSASLQARRTASVSWLVSACHAKTTHQHAPCATQIDLFHRPRSETRAGFDPKFHW
jgi:hypothetical protein